MPQDGPIFTDEADEPVNPWKRGGGALPGGGSGGGGGGGISGLAGGGGYGGFAPPGQFGSIPGMFQDRRKKKFYTMDDETVNGGSVSTPAAGFAMGGQVPPSPRDTIPARLEPGEFVVPREAAQDPQNAQMLEQMQSQALQERGMGGGMQSQGLSREALVELLHVLLQGQAMGFSAGGMVPGPQAPVPDTQHFGLGAFMDKHPGMGSAYTMGLSAIPYVGPLLSAYRMLHGNNDAEDEASDNAALAGYQAARARSEQGYAAGGWAGGWNPWSRWQGPQSGFGGGTWKPGVKPQAEPKPPGGIVGVDPNANWTNPGTLGTLNEAGARDANDFASGVFRQAQLEGADPGAAAAYRLRALASAGRGAADAASKYRTEQAGAEVQRLYDLYKQSKDYEYQAKLKRIS